MPRFEYAEAASSLTRRCREIALRFAAIVALFFSFSVSASAQIVEWTATGIVSSGGFSPRVGIDPAIDLTGLPVTGYFWTDGVTVGISTLLVVPGYGEQGVAAFAIHPGEFDYPYQDVYLALGEDSGSAWANFFGIESDSTWYGEMSYTRTAGGLYSADITSYLDSPFGGPLTMGLTAHFDGVKISPFTAVPEANTWALMIGGLMLAGGVLRRRPRIAAFAVAHC
jgi:hypothetical protein